MSDFRFPHRVAGLRQVIAQESKAEADDAVDAMIVSYLENCRYLSGFSGSNALIIVTQKEALFLTDGRYAYQSSVEVPGFERVILPQGTDLAAAAAETAHKLGAKRVGYEAERLSVSAFAALEKASEGANPGGIELIGRIGTVEGLRQIKDADEVAALKVAIAAADEAFGFLVATAEVGMTELDLAWELETYLRRTKGATRLGFDSIIGSGPNSAIIHGRPTDRVIGSSRGPEFLLCDYGCEIDNYNSDITRTFVIGGEPTPRHQEIYNLVKTAQQAALDAIKPGVIGKDADAAARTIITAAGYGDNFGHGLGHGLGRSVHDQTGVMNPVSEIVLKAGMVITVEPGVYIDGFGGVRIEDDVLVTETGCEILTHSPKNLIVIG